MQHSILRFILIALTSLFFINLSYSSETIADLQKKAEKGDVNAQFKLGVAYDVGEGVAEDKAEALKWFKVAAEQGYVYAQYNLAFTYETSEGIEKNLAEAFKWYKLAAEQGFVDAQYNLGLFYYYGKGGQKIAKKL